MKRTLIAVAALIGLTISPAFAAQTTWDVDPAHSSVGFKVRHMMVSNVRGLFGDFKGSLVYDEADVTASRVEVAEARFRARPVPSTGRPVGLARMPQRPVVE